MDNPPSAAFVATLGHQVVGVFVASREACGGDELARIRAEFHVEDFIAFDRHRPRNQAVLTALALNPIFAGHCRFALKEVCELCLRARAHQLCVAGNGATCNCTSTEHRCPQGFRCTSLLGYLLMAKHVCFKEPWASNNSRICDATCFVDPLAHEWSRPTHHTGDERVSLNFE